MKPTGLAWYVGIPEAGKTTLAVTHAGDIARATGWPVLVIDSQGGVDQLAHVPLARSIVDVKRLVWSQRVHARFVPQDGDEVEEIGKLVQRCGRVVLLVDETAFWISAKACAAPSLLRLMRAHRHARIWLLATTQHFSADVPQAAVSCSPDIYVFRCTSPAVLDRLEESYGLDRTRVATLPQGRFLKVSTGFGLTLTRKRVVDRTPRGTPVRSDDSKP